MRDQYHGHIPDRKNRAVRRAVRSFGDEEVHPIAGEIDREASFPWEVVEKMGKLGYFGIQVPREPGGAGLDSMSYVIVIEEISSEKGDVVHKLHFDLLPRLMNSTSGFVHCREITKPRGPFWVLRSTKLTRPQRSRRSLSAVDMFPARMEGFSRIRWQLPSPRCVGQAPYELSIRSTTFFNTVRCSLSVQPTGT